MKNLFNQIYRVWLESSRRVKNKRFLIVVSMVDDVNNHGKKIFKVD